MHPYKCGLVSNVPLERLNGIQEVSGSIPLISTKSPENTWFSGLFLFVLLLFSCFFSVLETQEKQVFYFMFMP